MSVYHIKDSKQQDKTRLGENNLTLTS